MARSKDTVLADISSQASYFARCREIRQGINSKDTVRMSGLIREAIDAGAGREEIAREFPRDVDDMIDFSYELAVRTRPLGVDNELAIC